MWLICDVTAVICVTLVTCWQDDQGDEDQWTSDGQPQPHSPINSPPPTHQSAHRANLAGNTLLVDLDNCLAKLWLLHKDKHVVFKVSKKEGSSWFLKTVSRYISACRHPDNPDNVHLEMQRNENGPGQVKNAPLFWQLWRNKWWKLNFKNAQTTLLYPHFIFVWYFVFLNLTFDFIGMW